MEKYINIAYEAYRQDTPTSYMTLEQFKKKICSCLPWYVYLAGGAALGYALKK